MSSGVVGGSPSVTLHPPTVRAHWLLLVAACSTDTFGPPSDAGVDAAADATEGGGNSDGSGGCLTFPTCAAPSACTDFDNGPNFFSPFLNTAQGSGVADTTTDHRVSCPNSFRSTIQAGATATGRATIGLTVPSPGTSLPVQASLLIDAWLPSNVTGEESFILIATDVAPSAVGLGAGATGWYLYDQATGTIKLLSPAPLLDTWNHIQLDATFSPDPAVGGVAITYDAAGGARPAVPMGVSTLPTGTSAVATFYVELGITPTTAAPTATLIAYYDDAMFTPL